MLFMLGTRQLLLLKPFSLHCLPKSSPFFISSFHFFVRVIVFIAFLSHFCSSFHSRQFLQMSRLLFYFQFILSEKSSHSVQTKAMTEIMIAGQFCPLFLTRVQKIFVQKRNVSNSHPELVQVLPCLNIKVDCWR